MGDPLGVSFLVSVASNAVSDYLNRQSTRNEAAAHELARRLQGDPLLQQSLMLLHDAIAARPEPAARLERVSRFLHSPRVETVVRKMCALHIMGASSYDDALRMEFIRMFVTEVEDDPQLANEAYVTLRRVSERAVGSCLRTGDVSSEEARSALMQGILLHELRAINKGRHHEDDPAVLEEAIDFEARLRKEIGERHALIVPPHFDRIVPAPIDAIYVFPEFLLRTEGQETSFTHEELLARAHRAVILGDPGSGKTTLVKRICHEFSTHHAARLMGGRRVTAVPVTLREVAADRKRHGTSMLRLLEAALATYQVPVPEGALDRLLRLGRVAVVFDGLDEILDASERRDVAEEIASFGRRYPVAPIVVTSRKIGYRHAPLPSGTFTVFELREFDEERVASYVRKWFALSTDMGPADRETWASDFLRASEVAPDLRANPLLLALMCNIYRGGRHIPENRPDVYEKCALMLFERHDRNKGIPIALPFESHLSATMKHVAHEMHFKPQYARGMGEADLVATVTRYLWKRKYSDEEDARAAAHRLVDYCRDRAWVFTEVGKAEGGGVYAFAHRTFLEYFAASHLARIHPSPHDLAPLLAHHVARGEAEEVSSLAVQVQHRTVEDAGDDILRHLAWEALRHARAGALQEAMNLAAFASRCLGFIMPAPAVQREVVRAFHQCHAALPPGGGYPARLKETLVNLLAVAPYERAEVRPALLEMVGRDLASPEHALRAGRLLFQGRHALRDRLPSAVEAWERDVVRLLREAPSPARAVLQGDPAHAAELALRGFEEPSAFAARFGIRALYEPPPWGEAVPGMPGIVRGSIVDEAVSAALAPPESAQGAHGRRRLYALGALLRDARKPCMSVPPKVPSVLATMEMWSRDKALESLVQDPQAFESLLWCLAPAVEDAPLALAGREEARLAMLREAQAGGADLPLLFLILWQRRFKALSDAGVPDVPLRGPAATFFQEWTRGKVFFVGDPPTAG